MDETKIIENSAKAIIVDSGKVLLIRYDDTTEFGLGVWYSLPGGRQQYDEPLDETMVRECKEEIGAEVRVDRLLFVREYIHSRHSLAGKGRDQHKVEFMFSCSLVRATGRAYFTDPDQSAVEWVALDKLSDIKIFPTRLKNLKEMLDKADAPIYWGDVY